MRKKLTTVLLVFAILLTYTPSHIFAQECMEHTWGEWHKMFDSTCTEDGLQRRICKECYVEETKPIPAIGHHTGGNGKQAMNQPVHTLGLLQGHVMYAMKAKKKHSLNLKTIPG